ncbi:hypothetical protein D0C36_08865 [Mucilaginibacter conchicola]|uniref:Oligosaccharide repeat unit polymerase n=1 Tax=Mucilaginibacter conchicola TaxID=2303333 RepID=A0A372NZS2_9SPHI|nr:hypothetical protein [Mucilaginibacter conchicola]RFZ95610.1 hypothetical protein D0C36_08865 [Mucilaginibacter conchicola]
MIKNSPFRYLIIYLPFLLALLLRSDPHVSYLTAWAGSFFIFFISFSGFLKVLPKDYPVSQQLMRPIFFMQLIFVGYMSCTSIFYYVGILGYKYFDYVGKSLGIYASSFDTIAQCQRYYALGHAALVHGIFMAMKYPVKEKYVAYVPSISNLLLGMCVICFPLGVVFAKIGALSQFSVAFTGLSFVSGTVGLAFAIREKKKGNYYFGICLFMLNLVSSLSSGFKEPVIVCVLLLGVYLLPIFGKKIIPFFSVILLFLFFVLPTFIGNFRNLTGNGVDVITARDESINAVLNSGKEGLLEDNWVFLTDRISEIKMFTQFADNTPYFTPYYQFKLVKNAISMIIPRFFWPDKPVVEDLVMERVYTAQITSRDSSVSAKPAFIVDCYLSYGVIGVWIGLFLYGYSAQRIAQKADQLFGGYFLGTSVIFAGLFQIYWRGNCFEFMANNIFWSYVTMLIIFRVLRARSILELKTN